MDLSEATFDDVMTEFARRGGMWMVIHVGDQKVGPTLLDAWLAAAEKGREVYDVACRTRIAFAMGVEFGEAECEHGIDPRVCETCCRRTMKAMIKSAGESVDEEGNMTMFEQNPEDDDA